MTKFGSTISIRENVPLASYTTLGIGGPARYFVAVKREEQIPDALDFASKCGCPVFILGSGSNIVVSDSGFPGLIIKIEITGIQSFDDERMVSVAAGEEWDSLAQRCVSLNLAGIECLSGIPGTVGAAPVQNIGAYGEEVSEVILSVRVFDRESQEILELSATECKFAYRSSIFNTSGTDRYIILKVSFGLRMDGAPCIHYRDLQLRFGKRSRPPSLREVRDAVLQIRESKAMVLRDNDPDSKSVGSFFKNPVLNSAAAAQAESRARACGLLGISEKIPNFQAPAGKEKLPAAWLIERAGFAKGFVRGNAAISGKHTLALVNRGGASAQEILDLMRLIQERVYELFGVELQSEPIFLGFPVARSPFPVKDSEP
jgi:UDP-N-acetylmuramate dehydrogenase